MSRSFRFISSGGIALAALSLLRAQHEGHVPPPSYSRTVHGYVVPPVTLVDAGGRSLKLDSLLATGPVLLQFIFTTCTTVCPILTATLAGAQDKLDAGVRLISISIDPENDTPARLAEYARRFHARPQWLFLTGNQADIGAVQRAFGAEERSKMNHRPLTFLRGAPGQPWVRLDGLTSAAELVAEYRRVAAGFANGKRIYREGILLSGDTIRAVVSRDVAVEGTEWRCEACHRRSGLGGLEAGTLVPPITADALFEPAEPGWAHRFPRLFEDSASAQFRAHVRSAQARPAYTEATLAAALRQGIDPAGRALDPAMPRYRLDEADLSNLTTYLAALGRGPSSGVDATTIHFATVITEGVDPLDRASLLAVLGAWFRQKDREADYHDQKRGRSAWHKDDEYRASRRWTLDIWEPKGPPETWTGQLAAYYQRSPVFAIVGGLAAGPWQPIADFCDRFEVVCLFPETGLPGRNSEHGYTVYFSRGVEGEAAALATYLRGSGVMQLYGESPLARAASAAFRLAKPDAVTLPLPAGPLQTIIREHHPDHLVIWADDADLHRLACDAAVNVYLSATLVQDRVPIPVCGSVFLISPYAHLADASQERTRMKNWQLSRGIPMVRERLQLNTHFALALLDDAIARMNGRFSGDYLLETIERETETSPSPGVFPRLSLGPGQRFASKGAQVVQWGGPSGVRPVSEWIVP